MYHDESIKIESSSLRCLIAIFFAIGIFVFVFALVSANDESTVATDETLRIISRYEWEAIPPISYPIALKVLPPLHVIISHTATTFCYIASQCMMGVSVIQKIDIESRGWDDIAYNFLVGGDGNIYEGRGWDVMGAHTFNYNNRSIGIAFIGTFNSEKPTEAQVQAAQKLIAYGVKNGRIRKDYKLLGTRQCIQTASPGEVLYNIIKTWDHWSPTP